MGVQPQTEEFFMEWLTENWFWVLIGILFVVIHLFGHGGHGGGGHGASHKPDDGPDRPSGHRH